MKIVTNIKVDKNIQGIEPLNKEQVSQLYKDTFGNISKVTSNNIYSFLEQVKLSLIKYKQEYDQVYTDFIVTYRASQNINYKYLPQLSDKDQLKAVSINQTNSLSRNEMLQDVKMIRVLEKGNLIMSEIRRKLTNTNLNTHITVDLGEGTMPWTGALEEISGYRLMLSTFGSSKNNPFSLAYVIDDNIRETLKNYQIDNIDKYRKSIYTTIMGFKEEYLQRYSELHGGKKQLKKDWHSYKQVFNSKDAEILGLFISNKMPKAQLTINYYSALRDVMGGGGGYATPAIKGSDYGKNLEKYFGDKQDQVNMQRMRNIELTINEIINALSLDKDSIADALASIFLEDPNRILTEDKVAKAANEKAREFLYSLFKT